VICNLNEHLSNLTISGYILKNKYNSFNSYPLNFSQALILKIGSYFLLSKSEKSKAKLNYYFSDCLEFENVRNFATNIAQIPHLPESIVSFGVQKELY